MSRFVKSPAHVTPAYPSFANTGGAHGLELGLRRGCGKRGSWAFGACRSGASGGHTPGDFTASASRRSGVDVGDHGSFVLGRIPSAGRIAGLAGLVLGVRAGVRPDAHRLAMPEASVSSRCGTVRRRRRDLPSGSFSRRQLVSAWFRLHRRPLGADVGDRRADVGPRAHGRRRQCTVWGTRAAPRVVRLGRAATWAADRRRAHGSRRSRSGCVVPKDEIELSGWSVVACRGIGQCAGDVTGMLDEIASGTGREP